jgi:hypothetical protein
MTAPPLPDTPCIRVKLDYNLGEGGESGSRLFFKYSGGPPTATDLNTLAGDIATAWTAHLAPLISTQYALKEVDILDINSDSGASGVWTGSNGGSRSGNPPGWQMPFNIEYLIARRYRGGKPRMYLPAGVIADQVDPSHWDSTLTTAVGTGFAAFIAAIVGTALSSLTVGAHVNLSYYSGFHNVTNSSGRTRAAPTYRALAKSDVITGYLPHALISSQRRRRAATTP